MKVLVYPLRLGMWDARDMMKAGRMCGVLLLKKGRGEWRIVLSSHDRNGENCKRMNGARKGNSFWEREVYYYF